MNARRALLRVEVPFGAFGLALVALAFVFAATGIPAWIPAAPMARLGVPSPLTGMTRSFVALASGDLGAAFVWHPIGPLAFAACITMPVIAIASWMRDARSRSVVRVIGSRVFVLSVVALLALAWARQIATFG